ncbi:guanylate kinase [Halanaerobaculum tunisiense]
MANKEGNLIILSGPSGVGKGTVLDALLEKYDDIYYSISATTRRPREGEIDGEDYFFMSPDQFETQVNQEEFLEWAKVHNNYYGTPKNYVQNKLQAGSDVILEIDIQGAQQVKERFKGGVFIFLAPPSLEELKKRISRRGTESKEAMETRLQNAQEELAEKEKYDYLVVNDKLAEAVEKIKAIIIAERCKL